jgi:hypothetical protein
MIEIEAPDEFVCSISLEVMSDPVMSRYGQSFERYAILQWLNKGHGVCPLSRRPMSLQDLVTNNALRLKIQEWQEANGQEVKVVVKTRRDQHVYGFITLPTKDEDSTERTVDEEDDLVYIDLNRLRRQQERIAAMYGQRSSSSGRHHRRHSLGSNTENVASRSSRRRSSLTRPFRGIRNLFAASSAAA